MAASEVSKELFEIVPSDVLVWILLETRSELGQRLNVSIANFFREHLHLTFLTGF